MRRHLRKLFLNFLKLFTAFSFYRLRGSDLPYFQYVYPSVFALLAWVFYAKVSDTYLIIKLDSFVASATTLMGVLVGFYIAALAAVTSFPNESLDHNMSGDPPKMMDHKLRRWMPITRRRFLSTLLGYCAFMSIFLFVLGSASVAVEVEPTAAADGLYVLKFVWWVAYTWLLASLFVVTMLCLHYLIDRMHRE